MRPFTGEAIFLALLPEQGQHPQQAIGILRRTNLRDPAGQELLASVAIALDGRIVDLDEAEGLRVVDPHGPRVFLEEDANLALSPGLDVLDTAQQVELTYQEYR